MAGLSRRTFLITGAAGAGLLVGWSLLPTQFDNPIRAAPDDHVFNSYLRLTPSGSITISIPVLDFGLGESTLIAHIIAQEMGADWRTIAIEPATPSQVYTNMALLKRWAPIIAPQDIGESLNNSRVLPSDLLLQRYADQAPFMITGEATTLANYLEPCRNAGAAARILLAKAAAQRWNIAWEECTAANNFINNGEERFSFAQLAEDAVQQDVPDILPLRPEGLAEQSVRYNVAQNTIGEVRNDIARTFHPRLDLPAKVDGSANFSADIRLPDMLYAAARQGPLGQSKVKSFDSDAAMQIADVVDSHEGDDFVAVMASNWWAANIALTASRPQFTSIGRLADSEQMQQTLDDALNQGTGYRLQSFGDIGDMLAQNDIFVQRYRAAPSLHCTVETQAATARFANGRAEIWYAAQAPAQTRAAIADALNVAASDVIIYPMPSAAGYGKALDHRPAIQAAILARQTKRPVQLIWSRGEEQVQSLPRPPALIELAALTRVDGAINMMQHKIAAPAAGRQTMDRLFDNDSPAIARNAHQDSFDRHMIAGALAPYAIDNISIDHHPANIALPVGMMRADSETLNCFARECFIDELARKAMREPLSYRVQMLGQAPQLVACLSQAATMAGWDGGSRNSGQGLACHAMHGAMAAIVASAQAGAGGVRVSKLSIAVNIGQVINPDIALQQLESAIVQGLTNALGGTSDYQKGVATARHLRDYNLPVLADMPDIDIFLMPSDAPPLDADSIAIAPVAPAIANALFSATGFRFRQLPLI
jgi:isoquinoline 1-oxidoreductase beta subunit